MSESFKQTNKFIYRDTVAGQIMARLREGNVEK